MLLGIDPVLCGPLLCALDRLGHGDALVVCDANFPAHRLGSHVIEVGADAPGAVRAIRSVLPVDPDEPMALMADLHDSELLRVHEEIMAAADRTHVVRMARREFYEAAGVASLIIRTSEARPYGNVLLHKGVVTWAPEPVPVP